MILWTWDVKNQYEVRSHKVNYIRNVMLMTEHAVYYKYNL